MKAKIKFKMKANPFFEASYFLGPVEVTAVPGALKVLSSGNMTIFKLCLYQRLEEGVITSVQIWFPPALAVFVYL